MSHSLYGVGQEVTSQHLWDVRRPQRQYGGETLARFTCADSCEYKALCVMRHVFQRSGNGTPGRGRRERETFCQMERAGVRTFRLSALYARVIRSQSGS